MNLQIDALALRKALSTVKKAQGYGATYQPVFRAVRLCAEGPMLAVSATDLDLACTVVIPAEIDSAGLAVVVSLKSLADSAKGKGSLRLSGGDESLTVTGATTSVLPTLDPAEWPADHPVEGSSFPVDLSVLAEVASAASRDDARPILAGVQFNGSEIVATDSYRLHGVTVPGSDFGRVLVPARLFAAAGKAGIGTLTVAPEDEPRYVRLLVGNTVWTSRTIPGQFPNWRTLVPRDQPIEVTTDRLALRAIVEGIRPGGSAPKRAGDVTPVRLSWDTDDRDSLRVAIEAGVGDLSRSGSLPAKIVDPPKSIPKLIALSPWFLADVLAAGRSETVSFGITDALKPVLCRETRPDGVESFQLLMPVRVS